jgi:hypothetical protein
VRCIQGASAARTWRIESFIGQTCSGAMIDLVGRRYVHGREMVVAPVGLDRREPWARTSMS